MVADLTHAPLTGARRIVVKIGSALLVEPETGALRQSWLSRLAEDVAVLWAQGVEVALVSSGAIALGRGLLADGRGSERADSLEHAQAAAAVGQIALAEAYAKALGAHGLRAGQVLMTLADTEDRRRYLNARATLATLLAHGVTPIVNENDTVATDEIRYGDNDRLAARAASLIEADRLILLSDVDGLYTSDPRRDPAARRLDVVAAITPEIEAMAGGAGTAGAKGGMVTKIMAAKIATAAGAAMAVMKGSDGVDAAGPLARLAAGAPCTWFAASPNPRAARKRWIAGMKPRGALIVDAGAAAALGAGRSLLPAGLARVEGAFERGDPVSVLGADGAALGMALAGYSAAEARRVAGLRSAEIEAALGYPARAALAHRDDLVLWAEARNETEGAA